MINLLFEHVGHDDGGLRRLHPREEQRNEVAAVTTAFAVAKEYQSANQRQ